MKKPHTYPAFSAQRPKHERNFWYWLFNLVPLLLWVIMVALLVLFHFIRPEGVYDFMSFGEAQYNTSWDATWTQWWLYGLWGCCGLTLVLMLLKPYRGRRTQDGSWGWLLLLVLVSCVFLLGYYWGVF